MKLSHIDKLDVAILEALQENARISLSELGRQIGLSQPAMSERVKRLEERGIITGYGARIDVEVLGLGMTAIIRLKTTHEHIRAAIERFARMPQVMDVYRLTGEDCFLLKVIVPTRSQLETIVDAIARFGAVTTSVVLRSERPKPITAALLELGLGAERRNHRVVHSPQRSAERLRAFQGRAGAPRTRPSRETNRPHQQRKAVS